MDDDQHSPSASQLLRTATDDLATDVDTLVRGGIARGRTRRRRHRAGTALAAAAVVGITGVAASVGPGLVRDDGRTPSLTDRSATEAVVTTPAPVEQPRVPDRPITVGARDVPAAFAEALGGPVGPVREGGTFPLVDEAEHKIVHFGYAGTLTTFIIERADSLATCAEQVDPVNQPDGQPGGECVVRDGVEMLFSEPQEADRVTAQGASAWVHGYIVSAVSYNATDGKDVEPVTEEPPISLAELEDLVTSDVWFAARPVERIAVRAQEIPDLVTAVVPGEVVPFAPYGGFINAGSDVVAHVQLDGFLTSAGISAAQGDPGRRCREGYPEPGACTPKGDGSVVGRGTSDGDGVTSRSVTVFRPGFDVFVMSYNAAEGKESTVLSPEPPLTYADLEAIASSDGWVSGS